MKITQLVLLPTEKPGEEFGLDLPAKAEIVSFIVQVRAGQIQLASGEGARVELHFFALVVGDPSAIETPRRFVIVGTNQAVPDDALHLGSARIPEPIDDFVSLFEIPMPSQELLGRLRHEMLGNRN